MERGQWEKVTNIKIEKRMVWNPQGLDEILSEILCRPVHGDWDRNIPEIIHARTLEEATVQGEVGDVWGKMMEKFAREYLSKNLQELGWEIKGGKIQGHEYDCIGRISGSPDRIPELTVEMYFPEPKTEGEYCNATERSLKMIRKLAGIEAKRKYVLIGVPKNTAISVLLHEHPTIKTLFQEYKFRKLQFSDHHT
jgi:hypothetical protein